MACVVKGLEPGEEAFGGWWTVHSWVLCCVIRAYVQSLVSLQIFPVDGGIREDEQ